jgi:hypothetical protein
MEGGKIQQSHSAQLVSSDATTGDTTSKEESIGRGQEMEENAATRSAHREIPVKGLTIRQEVCTARGAATDGASRKADRHPRTDRACH